MSSVDRRLPSAETERPSGYRVAVVGATGLVGREMVSQLEEREFPVRELVLFASPRSEGSKMSFNGRELTVQTLSPERIRGFDLALFSAGTGVALEWAPRFGEDGCMVIDNSSAWRMNPDVPLVAAGVNDDALDQMKKLQDAHEVTTALEEKGIPWRLLKMPDNSLVIEVQDPK